MTRRKIAVFGAGLVARPAIAFLLREFAVVLVDADGGALERQRRYFDDDISLQVVSGELQHIDMASILTEAACAVSLLPASLHPTVAAECVRYGCPLVTTSYVSPAMQMLDHDARQSGIALLNECGLDPGIDHMLAMRSIDAFHRRGATVRSFISMCGGIPSDASVNPWGYKLSWTPAGVIAAARQSASYLDRGEVHELSAPDVFSACRPVAVEGMGALEAFYNRDSLPYIARYRLEGEVRTFARMTLRYVGWCKLFQALTTLGILDDGPVLPRQPICQLVDVGVDPAGARASVMKRLSLSGGDHLLAQLDWLGLFSGEMVPAGCRTRIDVLVALMTDRMGYRNDESDAVVLQHEICAEWSDHAEAETVELVVFGSIGEASAMSKTVGIPAAAAATLLANKGVLDVGVITPTLASLYAPLLAILEAEGIVAKRSSTSVSSCAERS